MTYILKPHGLYDGTSRTASNPIYADRQVSSTMTINSNTRTKIATLPQSSDVKGAMAVNLRWSNGVVPGTANHLYWETHIGFTYGQIGGNAYNATGTSIVSGWTATYHHRTIGEPTQLEVDSDSTSGNYGIFSLYITVPNYITLNTVRCDVVSLCGGYPE
jgi:hypothetical protein